MRSKRKAPSNHGMWWVTLLMYTHVVYSALTVLNCPTITDTHGASSFVRRGQLGREEGKEGRERRKESMSVCNWVFFCRFAYIIQTTRAIGL